MTATARDSLQILDRDFLEIRAKILEIAAGLDRIGRAPAHHGEHPDPRIGQIRQALDALLKPDPDRAETVQLIFSLEYDDAWREKTGVDRDRPAGPRDAR
ncbi:hypothetical protein [Planctomyces sp. SH-PL62]|uniref:hypothetical protein n=1 Tax=Planctomyces sp. SH-PL62 TaxID=1636152 RepID=UPI00078C6ECF|nr:hypothetical protein [Planctomyces sp. SH-PL62]AMV36481.1 hypothetical protein VT85_03550 [Planctomyces sp. SH-PL62]